jgi:hypothetical protein
MAMSLRLAGTRGYFFNASLAVVMHVLEHTTNYIDSGASTDLPARYYRLLSP